MSIPRLLLRGNQQGLTLIEILVAMTISLVLLAGVVQILAGSKASYRINEAHSRIQENGRFALQMMAEDIRMAGFWGCLGDNTLVADNVNPGAFDPLLGGVTGAEGGVGLPPPADSIVLQGGVGDGLPVNDHNVGASTITTMVNNGLAQDNLFLVGDCTRVDLLQITNADANATGAVTFLSGAGNPNATAPIVAYGVNAVLYRADRVAYTIAIGNGGQPSLFRGVNGAAAMELVEGVENLQILYGEDLNADGTANYYDAANIVNMANVVSVRVILTLRSLNDNLASIVDPVALDRRLRRTFSSTIVLRNRIP